MRITSHYITNPFFIVLFLNSFCEHLWRPNVKFCASNYTVQIYFYFIIMLFVAGFCFFVVLCFFFVLFHWHILRKEFYKSKIYEIFFLFLNFRLYVISAFVYLCFVFVCIFCNNSFVLIFNYFLHNWLTYICKI